MRLFKKSHFLFHIGQSYSSGQVFHEIHVRSYIIIIVFTLEFFGIGFCFRSRTNYDHHNNHHILPEMSSSLAKIGVCSHLSMLTPCAKWILIPRGISHLFLNIRKLRRSSGGCQHHNHQQHFLIGIFCSNTYPARQASHRTYYFSSSLHFDFLLVCARILFTPDKFNAVFR